MKEKLEKTRHVKNNIQPRKYILRGERKARSYDGILSNVWNSIYRKLLCTPIDI